MAVLIEDFIPVIKYNGLNSAKDGTLSGAITFSGSATLPSSQALTSPVITSGATISTGSLVISANSAGVSFTGTGTLGGILTNLYNDTASTLSGTQKDIKILIGTVPYYFTVYPTKA